MVYQVLRPKFNSHIVVVVYVVWDRFGRAYLKTEKYLWHSCVFTAPTQLENLGPSGIRPNIGDDLNVPESEDV